MRILSVNNLIKNTPAIRYDEGMQQAVPAG